MREYSLAFPVNREIKIFFARSHVLTIEEKDISIKLKLQKKEKTDTWNHLLFSVFFSTGKLFLMFIDMGE